MFNLTEIFSVSLVLFSVIDILGSLPVIIELQKKQGDLNYNLATLVAGGLMVGFLFLGESILRLFSVDVQSFALAGAIVIFLIGLEMILGLKLFQDSDDDTSSSIVPIAFPLIAGAGTMTTLISLRAEFEKINVLAGIFVNLLFVYLVLRSAGWLSSKIGNAGLNILRKVFGIILLSISIKLFKTNL